MTDDHAGEGLTDKVRHAAEKVEEALESHGPDGASHHVNDATDPFADDQRPDEAGYPHGSVAGVE